jgi:hypothetical protein
VTLAETQALFAEAISGGAPLPPGALERCFAGTPALPAAARVAIYADMYRFRLIDALRDSYPSLFRLLGDETFAALADDYLHRHPSEHHDVGQVGRHLADFLRRHPDPERLDLADLAALEWARQEAFFAPSAAPIGAEAMAGLDAEGVARTGLALAPSLRLLSLDHDSTPLWRRLEDGQPPGPPLPGPAAVAVWRTGFEVFHALLELEEAAALAEALRGATLASICAAFATRDDPAAAAHAALSSWLVEGWVVGLRP